MQARFGVGAAAVALFCLNVTSLYAQIDASRAPERPSISVSAQGSTRITPDRATIQIGVQTQGATAAAASAENARVAQRVIAAIKAIGIGAEQISTVNYSVNPDYRHIENRPPEVTGYTVHNTVVVDVRQIEQVGRVIDAALSSGANVINSLSFYASNTEDARRAALATAVEKARLDAEVIARAAGGSLGGLAEASVGAYMIPRGRENIQMMRGDMAAAAAPTPVEPGSELLSVQVMTRWYFVSGR
ncbi:MAG TPA: SIMPL domain-containing protein [Gemmatimonadaceae bacterium]|nr:SIMPL domain-containing protein [Gemmatimonadaceae bacterium]